MEGDQEEKRDIVKHPVVEMPQVWLVIGRVARNLEGAPSSRPDVGMCKLSRLQGVGEHGVVKCGVDEEEW